MSENKRYAPLWACPPKGQRNVDPDILEICRDLQRTVTIMSRLAGIDLYIINTDYLCVAGSGFYEAAVGCVSPRDTAIGYSLASGRPTMVADPKVHAACRDCSQRLTCRDLANYTSPIAVHGRIIAAVQVVAFDAEQCAILMEKAEDMTEAITLYLIQSCEADSRLLSALAGSADEIDSSGLERLIGESKAMRSLKDDIIRCAPLDSTVLIQGESGTGKELTAQAIHDLSLRAAAPFVAVNCGAIPEAIIESELFGYAAGTFTGAQKGGKAGLFEHAEGGTLFLDEIAELPLQLQVKLLRVLQERKVMRLGGRQEHSFDVRIIAAANVDVADMARDGKFRQDLYFRLSVIPLYVPALRERDGDIELLVHHFARLYARRRNEPQPAVDPELMKRFISYRWPGNVRELKNFVEYGINFRKGRVLDLKTLEERFNNAEKSQHLDHNPFNPLSAGSCPGNMTTGSSENEVLKPEVSDKDFSERQTLSSCLSKYGSGLEGKRRTAEELGISLATLYRKIKKYSLQDAYRYDVGSQ
jgi:transcriptional regulator with PAS, ATPase and Fis domain